jgi:hypothetical protein
MKKNTPYSSFEQIDKDLKILRLQSEITKEELKLSFHETKEELTPGKLITGIVGSLATSALLLKLLVPIISFGIDKLLDKYR